MIDELVGKLNKTGDWVMVFHHTTFEVRSMLRHQLLHKFGAKAEISYIKISYGVLVIISKHTDYGVTDFNQVYEKGGPKPSPELPF